MSDLEDFAGGEINLHGVRSILHHEFDLALDATLLDLLHRPLDGLPVMIAIEVTPALLEHIQEKLP